ncbi:MAG TPA: diacylglycerol kinase family protein [Candidatus Peribacteraceae bacterium]|nr:diacylglycerol kinase family protein [Candidatus Peribacteraceae bacterium]
MLKLWKSFGYARHGLIDALKTEQSLRLFALGFSAVLLVSYFYHLTLVEWMLLLFSGALFVAVELLNTAMEHAVDVIDEHRPKSSDQDFHKGLKAAKDIAAAAALVTLMLVLAVILIIFVPKIF